MLSISLKQSGYKTESLYVKGMGYIVSASNGTDAFNGAESGSFKRIGRNSYWLESGHTINENTIEKLKKNGVSICW